MGNRKNSRREERSGKQEGKEAKLNKVTMGMYEDVTKNFIFYT